MSGELTRLFATRFASVPSFAPRTVTRTFLKSSAYCWIMRLLGLLLIVYAVMLFNSVLKNFV